MNGHANQRILTHNARMKTIRLTECHTHLKTTYIRVKT